MPSTARRQNDPIHDNLDLNRLTDDELLQSIRRVEARYKILSSQSHTDDHRRHLSRPELERVYCLVSHRAMLRETRVPLTRR